MARMEFILYYRGPLKTNRGPTEKHEIRSAFHGQLKEFFRFCHDDVALKNEEFSARENPGLSGFNFISIIDGFDCIAELAITMLRPEAPGKIITNGGDIDNRLKTLLDALKVPTKKEEIPPGIMPNEDQKPFFCLLADDKLVTAINVTTFQLHDPTMVPPEVILLIQVKTKASRPGLSSMFT